MFVFHYEIKLLTAAGGLYPHKVHCNHKLHLASGSVSLKFDGRELYSTINYFRTVKTLIFDFNFFLNTGYRATRVSNDLFLGFRCSAFIDRYEQNESYPTKNNSSNSSDIFG